jgi:NitT/TauT family transport system ATP-binding protein
MENLDSAGDAMIALEQVSKRFSHNGSEMEALRSVDLTVRKGEFACLVGPSGCGKSTLIALIAGLERPSEGRILVDGIPVNGPGPDRVVVFQEPALFPWLTVRANVEFGLKMQGIAQKERRTRSMDLLRMVHLTRFADFYPHQLSGGMKQRVAIARALAMDPKILLMDEPFAGVDPQTRRILHRELMEIWMATQKTVLFVTHNVREATVLADRVFIMTKRPGHIKGGYAIHLPRPRRESDPHLMVVQQQILLKLEEEIAKVVQDEDQDAGSDRLV